VLGLGRASDGASHHPEDVPQSTGFVVAGPLGGGAEGDTEIPDGPGQGDGVPKAGLASVLGDVDENAVVDGLSSRVFADDGEAHAGLRVDRRRSADAWALASSIALVAEAQALRPELRAAVLLTRLTSSTALSRGARGVVEGAGLPVLRAALGYRVAFAESLAAGQGVTTYAPGDLARLEVEHLADELDAFGTDEESSRHVA